MNRTIRLILAIAFVIFLVAIIWAIVANNRSNKVASTTKSNTTSTQTIVGQPVTTTTPTTSTPAPATPAPQTAPKRTVIRRQQQLVIITETDQDFSDGASASAGVNADGSAWAIAEAN